MSQSIETLVHDSREFVIQVHQMCKPAIADEEVDDRTKPKKVSMKKRNIATCTQTFFTNMWLTALGQVNPFHTRLY